MVGPDTAAALSVHHPLQSFSTSNFEPGALGVRGPWSFDHHQLAGALAAANPRDRAPDVVFAWPLPFEREPVRLEALVAFFRNPAQRFLSQRLGLALPEPHELPDDSLPVELTGLARWRTTDRLLTGLLAGHDAEALLARERSSDELPAGRMGEEALQEALELARSLQEAAAAAGYDPRAQVPFAGTVEAEAFTVEGTVSANPERGHVALVNAGQIKGSHRLRLHIYQMFLTVLRPDIAWEGILIGKGEAGARPRLVTLRPPGRDDQDRPAEAARHLAELAAIFEEGMTRPLPLPCETGYAWQRNLGNGDHRARREAGSVFEGDFGESKDPSFRLVFPEVTNFAALQLRREFPELCQRVWLPVICNCRERRL
jgi:exodeoxyribonuclease V gamma subunit